VIGGAERAICSLAELDALQTFGEPRKIEAHGRRGAHFVLGASRAGGELGQRSASDARRAETPVGVGKEAVTDAGGIGAGAGAGGGLGVAEGSAIARRVARADTDRASGTLGRLARVTLCNGPCAIVVAETCPCAIRGASLGGTPLGGVATGRGRPRGAGCVANAPVGVSTARVREGLAQVGRVSAGPEVRGGALRIARREALGGVVARADADIAVGAVRRGARLASVHGARRGTDARHGSGRGVTGIRHAPLGGLASGGRREGVARNRCWLAGPKGDLNLGVITRVSGSAVVVGDEETATFFGGTTRARTTSSGVGVTQRHALATDAEQAIGTSGRGSVVVAGGAKLCGVGRGRRGALAVADGVHVGEAHLVGGAAGARGPRVADEDAGAEVGRLVANGPTGTLLVGTRARLSVGERGAVGGGAEATDTEQSSAAIGQAGAGRVDGAEAVGVAEVGAVADWDALLVGARAVVGEEARALRAFAVASVAHFSDAERAGGAGVGAASGGARHSASAAAVAVIHTNPRGRLSERWVTDLIHTLAVVAGDGFAGTSRGVAGHPLSRALGLGAARGVVNDVGSRGGFGVGRIRRAVR